MNSGFNQALSNTAKKLELSLMLDMIKSDMFLAQRGLLITSFAHDTERYAKHKEEFAARSRPMKEKLQEIRPLLEDEDSMRLLSAADKLYWDWEGLYPGCCFEV